MTASNALIPSGDRWQSLLGSSTGERHGPEQDGRHRDLQDQRPPGRQRSLPGRHLRARARQEVQPEPAPDHHRPLVEGRHPDRSRSGVAQPLQDHQHRQRDHAARHGVDERHLRQRRDDRRVRAARRRLHQGRPLHLQVPQRQQHRERVPRGDLPAHHGRRAHPGVQPALLRRDARARDRRARCATAAICR